MYSYTHTGGLCSAFSSERSRSSREAQAGAKAQPGIGCSGVATQQAAAHGTSWRPVRLPPPAWRRCHMGSCDLWQKGKRHRTFSGVKNSSLSVYAVHEVLHNEEDKPVMQVYILIPGTPSNLGVYVSWYRCGGRQAGVFLPDHTSGALKVSVDAGETLFIPGRVAVLFWPVSVRVYGLAACSTPSLVSLMRSHVRVCLQLAGCQLKWLEKTLWHCAATTCTWQSCRGTWRLLALRSTLIWGQPCAFPASMRCFPCCSCVLQCWPLLFQDMSEHRAERILPIQEHIHSLPGIVFCRAQCLLRQAQRSSLVGKVLLLRRCCGTLQQPLQGTSWLPPLCLQSSCPSRRPCWRQPA